MSEREPVTGVRFHADLSTLPAPTLPAATTTVTYRSAGHCLVVADAAEGGLARALDAVGRLPSLGCTVARPGTSGAAARRLTESGVAVHDVDELVVDGRLGAWTAVAHGPDAEPLDLAVSAWIEDGAFDLVLDLGATPLVTRRLPPPGYRHVAPDADAAALDDALETLDGLVGEFDKPTYFEYRSERCAHSRSSLPGCSRCIDVCATGAISSTGDTVSVDPYLCQGCGTCATRCPSGAMVYAYPRPADAIARTRELLGAGKGVVDTLVLHTEAHASAVTAAELPAAALDLEVEAVAAYGPDYWLTAAAAGVARILLVSDAPSDDPDRRALEEQARHAHALLAGLGAPEPLLHVVAPADLGRAVIELPVADALRTAAPAAFTISDDKRRTVRDAFDAIAERLPVAPAPAFPLPAGASFGRIRVDADACTLCMACVSTCPAGSLLDGQDRPALRQIEASCVQCGLCERACPEDAISLEARWVTDGVEARRTVVLHEEEPFHCVTCHKAFATRGIIDTMLDKLQGHWMFAQPEALRRLKMCEDCRVKDIFASEAGGIETHRTGPDP